MHVDNFVNQGYNEKFTPKLFHAGFIFLNFILYTFWFSFPLVIYCLFVHTKDYHYLVFFFIINKQYVYIYMYVILNFQRYTVGIQNLVCIRKDTDTWFDILYR